MSFIFFLVGSAFVIGGVAWALIAMGVSTTHVIMTALVLTGLAIVTGVTRTRTRD